MQQIERNVDKDPNSFWNYIKPKKVEVPKNVVF